MRRSRDGWWAGRGRSTRAGPGVKALAVVAAVVVLGAALWAYRSRPQVEAVTPVTSTSSAVAVPAPAPSSETAEVVVAVAGKVRRPGLVRLPAGARVADAVEAAGGALPGADLTSLNLARKVVDGELILVGVTPPPGVGGTAGAAARALRRGPVNLNTATLAELDALPGVGPVLAQRILDHRDAQRRLPVGRRPAQGRRHRRRPVRAAEGPGDGVNRVRALAESVLRRDDGPVVVPPICGSRAWPLAAWLSALGGLRLGALAGAVVAVAAAAARRRRGRRAGTGAGVPAGSVGHGGRAARASCAARSRPRRGWPSATRRRSRTLAAARARVTGGAGRPRRSARVLGRRDRPADVPRAGQPRPGRGRAPGRARLDVPARVLVLGSHEAWRTLLPGQRLVGRGAARPATRRRPHAPPCSSAAMRRRCIGEPSWAQRAAGALRAGLQRGVRAAARRPGGLLPGPRRRRHEPARSGRRGRLPGHRDDPPDRRVSGANVAIVVGRRAAARPLGPGRALAGRGRSARLALVGFVILARPSPSVVRAAAMGAIGLLALAAGRPRAALPALARRGHGAGRGRPGAGRRRRVRAVRAGHRRAAAARAAMARRAAPARACRPALAEALAVPAAAQVACAPVVAGAVRRR